MNFNFWKIATSILAIILLVGFGIFIGKKLSEPEPPLSNDLKEKLPNTTQSSSNASSNPNQSNHSKTPPPTQSVEFNAQKIGVFAETSSGTLELISRRTDSYDISEDILSRMPKAKGVNFYYVNIPEAEIAESVLFWTSSYQKYKDLDLYEPIKPETLKAEIESIKGSAYKIGSNELQNKKNGFVVLKIKMPLGTSDRLYPIKIE